MSAGATTRPIPFQGDLRNLPDALTPLKLLPNWVCWRWEWKINKKGVGKWDKPPFRPDRPHGYAKNNDPSTWGTYEQALAAFDAGECDGIGFNLSGTDIAAFDLDKCRDPETGGIAPEAMQIVNAATSYTEMTVSGTGLRIIGFGAGKKLHRKQKIPSSTVEIESYRKAERYIVITGNPLPHTWPYMHDIDQQMDEVVSRLHKSASHESFDFEEARKQDKANTRDDAFLPRELVELVQNGVPAHQDLSAAFHRVVCWLQELGWSASRIETYIAGNPIVPERYAKRLAGEIARCLHKAKHNSAEQSYRPEQEKKASTAPIELLWHGETCDRKSRSWLVKDLIPETGKGLASGQWGSAKTFGMIDLAGAVVTGLPFAGREVARRGGVLFVAAEGANEVPVRLQGMVEHKLRPHSLVAGAAGQPVHADLGKLPFAWIEECPSLKEDFPRLLDAARATAEHMRERFKVPLALIIIDTLNAAANFKDGNDAAEGQFIMNRLQELSRSTGAFALAVDHFGKAVETGTRGTSAKEAAADAVLAFLADRDTAGNVKNLRLAVRKLRGGATGAETPYELQVVDLGNGDTTCVIDWREGGSSKPAGHADRWSRSLRVFRAAMATALAEHGVVLQPFGSEGPKVRAVPEQLIRQEFRARYVGEPSAKTKAFTRAEKDALAKELIACRELHGVNHLWFVEIKDEADIHTDKPDTP